jgi:catechol 2,3-dioxygenase-like lactoylglutathione lyase family enzyme
MQLRALTLTARDLERSRAFYTKKLGFAVVEESARSFVVDAGGVRLVVATDGLRSPLDSAEPRLVFVTNELGKRCMALRDLGVSVEGPVGGRAELADPDGHPINLVEAEPERLSAAEGYSRRGGECSEPTWRAETSEGAEQK